MRDRTMSTIKTYANEANAKRAIAQFKRHNKSATIFKHNRNDKRFKQQVCYAIYLK